MLVVTGDASPLRASETTWRHASGGTLPARLAGSSGSPPNVTCNHAHAIRHGCRIAASPPGIRTGYR